jgi:type IV pilus assembly protein PilW
MKKHILGFMNDKGFTLTELLVAMGLSAVVMASVGYVYYSQQKSYLVQENLAAAQQNIRAAMYFMEREIRMAGCDPIQSSPASITSAGPDAISFTSDLNGDGDTGDTNENITYSLDIVDNQIERGNQPIAENIDALDFVYLDGASPPNPLDDDGMGNVTTSINQIRSVQVSVVARTGRADPGYTNNETYRNQQLDVILGPQNDNFRRKQLDTIITLRNR